MRKHELTAEEETVSELTDEDLYFDELFEAIKIKGGKVTVNDKKFPGVTVKFLEGPNKDQEFKYACVTDDAVKTLKKNGKKITDKNGKAKIVFKLPTPDMDSEITWLNT